MAGPLDGKSVLVTRPKAQAKALIDELEALGATVVAMPTIEIVEPGDFGPFDDALQNLSSYDWVIFTSANGVEAVAKRLAALGIATSELTEKRIAVVGPTTGMVLSKHFREPDVTPDRFVAHAISDWLGEVAGKRILLPRADIARRELIDNLKASGAIVDDVTAYEIVRDAAAAELPDQAPDYITLTSSEAARSTEEKLSKAGKGDWLRTANLVCIGPITEATVRELGYSPAAVAAEYTARGVLQALLDHATRDVQHA